MDIKESFKKYYQKLIIEAVVKSALLGVAFGLAAGGVFSALALMFSFNGVWTIWVSVFLGVATAGIGSAFLYFNRFKPSFHEAAARVDQTGLEERMITMLELGDSETYIAQKQREDGRAKISGVTPKMMQYRFPLYAFIAIGLAAVFGISLMTGGVVNAVQLEREREDLYQKQRYEQEIIDRLIRQLEALIRGSRITAERREELITRVENLKVRVAALPTYKQKLDLVRTEIDAIRALLLQYIAELEAMIAAGMDMGEQLDAAWDLYNQITAEVNEILEGLNESALAEMPGPPGPPMPSQPQPSLQINEVGEIINEPGSQGGGPDNSGFNKGENILNHQNQQAPYYNDFEAYYDDYVKDLPGYANLTPEQKAQIERYVRQMWPETEIVPPA